VRPSLAPVPRVRGSEEMLSQIVLNLLVSALRAIPEGRPEENEVAISTSFEDGSVWLRVHDSGLPQRPAEDEALAGPDFDPLGAGSFALAVTQQLVSRHRGRIDMRSSPSGNLFLVELPVAPGGAA
jgi:signal transduction histidine kinase